MWILNPQILSGTSSSPKFHTYNKYKYKYNIRPLSSKRNSSFPIYLFQSRSNTTTKFQILAHFGRPTCRRRRNSLRKKLPFGDEQVRQSDFQNPNPSFDHNLSIRVINDERFKSSKLLGLSDNLDNWVEQNRKDIQDWGIGSAPIFTVSQDLEGNVKWVWVNEDEIVTRVGLGDEEVKLKIVCGKKNVIPRNSSAAKFVVQDGESGFVKAIQGFTLRPDLFPKISSVGRLVLFGFVALWALKKLFSFGDKEVHHTEVEKEMMRRKIKSRKEKETLELEKVSVEVVLQTSEPIEKQKPKLDKEQLMNSIFNKIQDSSVKEIRQMARRAGDIEGQELSVNNRDAKEKQAVNDEMSNEMELVNVHGEEDKSSLSNLLNGNLGQTRGIHETVKTGALDGQQIVDTGFISKVTSIEERDMQACTTSGENISDDRQSTRQDFKDSESALQLSDTTEVIQFSDTPDTESCMSKKNSIRVKTRVILSLKEAREYLSEKCDNQEPSIVSRVKTLQESAAVLRLSGDDGFGSNTSHKLDVNDKVAAISGLTSNYTHPTKASEVSAWEEFVPTKNDNSEDSEAGCGVGDLQKPQTSIHHECNGINAGTGPSAKMQNWIDTNFHEVEPLAKKIGAGFKDNYMVARKKVNEQLDLDTDIAQLGFSGDEGELEWMKDDSLSEIVFQVRENELAGRDPFYLMDAEDKQAFFMGLEEKVEKENEKLLKLHQWLHSNIENLDYGADGISLYDPPSKIIPRWKGPLMEKNPEFLENFLEQRKAFMAGNTGNLYPVKKDQENPIKKSSESPNPGNVATSSPALDSDKKFHDGDQKNSKTVIEGSDGSVIAGKRSGKEYWQHTKKWSRGFLDSYNAETDPEVKSIMKDIGKDLDRWITEKEIQEAADLMSKLPERTKNFMEKKLNKLKREMELFGPQAVVSKYNEYADEKEEDYLWWLDLPHVLCIELYTVDNGEQTVGLYSLEMATDLELEPKPYHVIAFEDAGDCKNLCYIIQAHMDMLGIGHAFVVPRPPKDSFWEAKANGFSVTVIRKGELQLNVDQMLEEVEEQITEIGSKIYHDKIMKERSVDISSLMKGVFGVTGKPTKRKGLKKMLKKPSKK